MWENSFIGGDDTNQEKWWSRFTWSLSQFNDWLKISGTFIIEEENRPPPYQVVSYSWPYHAPFIENHIWCSIILWPCANIAMHCSTYNCNAIYNNKCCHKSSNIEDLAEHKTNLMWSLRTWGALVHATAHAEAKTASNIFEEIEDRRLLGRWRVRFLWRFCLTRMMDDYDNNNKNKNKNNNNNKGSAWRGWWTAGNPAVVSLTISMRIS